MRTYPGLKFVILIVVGLGAAIALRAFAANKHKDAGLFRLEVQQRITLKCKEKCEEKIKQYLQSSPSYDVCFRDGNGNDRHWHNGPEKPSPCPEPSRPGSPHIQQQAAFDSIQDLKAAVDALAGSMSTSTPAASASPAPHIQQQVESNTPKAGKAIAEALAH